MINNNCKKKINKIRKKINKNQLIINKNKNQIKLKKNLLQFHQIEEVAQVEDKLFAIFT